MNDLPKETTTDLVEDWLQAHANQVDALRGLYIAIHPMRGLVVKGVNLKNVLQEVVSLELSGKVVISRIAELDQEIVDLEKTNQKLVLSDAAIAKIQKIIMDDIDE